MQKELIITNDGSHSFFVPAINESYHSIHGAILEAKHVFIKNGLLQKHNKKLNILEVGFGTGLNALLTKQKAEQKKIQINYHTIELYPIKESEYIRLNFTELIGLKRKDLIELHEIKWDKKSKISNNFILKKEKTSIKNYTTGERFDIIYYDAFSPEKQPELWKGDILEKMHQYLKKDGFLVTYCAKGVVRRTLTKIGFEVISLDGPPGKRQMTRANRK